jgi:hypothetical protein
MRRMSRLEAVRLELHQALQESPSDRLPKVLQLILQAALEQEVFEYRGRTRYERGPVKRGLRNGYESRILRTDYGTIVFDVPQLRETEAPYRSRIAHVARHIYPKLAELTQIFLYRPPTVTEVAITFTHETQPLLSEESVQRLTETLTEEHVLLKEKLQAVS